MEYARRWLRDRSLMKCSPAQEMLSIMEAVDDAVLGQEADVINTISFEKLARRAYGLERAFEGPMESVRAVRCPRCQRSGPSRREGGRGGSTGHGEGCTLLEVPREVKRRGCEGVRRRLIGVRLCDRLARIGVRFSASSAPALTFSGRCFGAEGARGACSGYVKRSTLAGRVRK